ncbi:ribonuclease, liver-like [Hyperolius riggenbachi]|uniref:ribonuclease, liver-like n=1 Tax=Hyperolius riggenbachi TaxID=752182 RepID=UPI0035A27BB5
MLRGVVLTGKMSPIFSTLLILGFFLTFTHLSSCENWPKFQQKHIRPLAVNCNFHMNQDVFYIKGKCKKLNTFIISRPDNVKAICASTAGNQKVRSTEIFTLNNCRYQSGTPGKCVYGIQPVKDWICVTCENRVPVHFVAVGSC